MRALVLLLVAAALAPVALAGGTPGVTSHTITIGGTVPITGPAALFGSVGRGSAAYFKYVNAHGGVNGRKINYVYLDDAYDPAKTVQLTRELVEQLPSFRAEGVIYGRYIGRSIPGAKIGVLFEDSAFGKELTDGLKKGLGSKKSEILSGQAYEPTDTTIESQMSTLHASGANVLVLNATPQYAILAYLAVHRFGWHPKIFISSVSVSPNVMDIIRANASQEVNGSLSIAFVKDPTDKVWAKDPVVALYHSILKKYAPGAKAEDVYNFYGMAVAYTMVDALKHAGKSPTRQSLLTAATHLDEVNPFMRPGIKIVTTPTDYYPISKAQLIRYDRYHWVAVGPLVSARG